MSTPKKVLGESISSSSSKKSTVTSRVLKPSKTANSTPKSNALPSTGSNTKKSNKIHDENKRLDSPSDTISEGAKLVEESFKLPVIATERSPHQTPTKHIR